MNWELIWLIVLSVVLVAHMIKDAMEFKKIKKLEDEVTELKKQPAGGDVSTGFPPGTTTA